MPELFLKQFSIDVQQKLYEKETPEGLIGLYQTASFGMVLTINGQVILSEQDGFFFHEMMAHPAIFTHPQPEKIAILGHSSGILSEVLKHTCMTEIHCVKHLTVHTHEWLKTAEHEQYDIIIQSDLTNHLSAQQFYQLYQLLQPDGIMVQACNTSLFQLKTLKPLYQQVKDAGFSDWQILNFPQPSFPSGWRTAVMATKGAMFKRVREKDVFNRLFPTRYYNFDVHQAALVLPEFMREEPK